jgi:hypothetical protein
MAPQAPFAREGLPFHRWVRALQNAKDSVFLLKHALHAARTKDKKALEFAEVEQPHYGIDIGVWQKDAADREGS